MKTKYQIITELEDRNIEIDREIDKLIQEKLNNKEKIEQLSSFNKSQRGVVMRTHTYWTTGEIEDLKYLRTVEKLSWKEIYKRF